MSQAVFVPTLEQQAIIDHLGSAFVTACPGAGKTRVMVERARLLFDNIPKGRGVAFLSFTKAAVSELEVRLRQEAILPSPLFPSFIGTFDSFVWQFLVAPFGLDDSDARPRLVDDIEELPVAPPGRNLRLPLSCFCPVTGAINCQKAREKGFDVSEQASSVVQAYVTAATNTRRRLRERGQLGFSEARNTALLRVTDTRVAARIAAALASRFHEVIVDEAQDCNPDDLRIISWLRNSGTPVKVVCDPHQSIFGFRGGVTNELLEFKGTFDEDEWKELTGNFRSAPSICKTTAQLRFRSSRTEPDVPLGRYKNEVTPVYILSYSGTEVSGSIGTAFRTLVEEAGIDLALSPILAATAASGNAAAGQPRPSERHDRAVRLAQAITGFYFASGFNDMKMAIEEVHRILLELEGCLDACSYRQYLTDNELEPPSWRPRVLHVLRELRFDPSKYADARAWHEAAKNLLTKLVMLRESVSISQLLRWNDAIASSLAVVPHTTAMPRTIHSVKGMEFPAVCVVTTASTLNRILNYLQTGVPTDMAEDARKLYVAASRAERLLAIAAPWSQTSRLAEHLQGQGADVAIVRV